MSFGTITHGLRPIGLGEVLQRISDKVIFTHARVDIVTSARFFQVCTVHEAGCKRLIYAMHTEQSSTEAVLLVDTSNAFNSVSRNAFLYNVEIICPSIE